jgi:16S rRNA C967 or C1407 C5-methylase (RsmB/RsmF family)
LEQAKVEAIEDEILKPYIDERGALSTLPWTHRMDGMFAVKIRKMT